MAITLTTSSAPAQSGPRTVAAPTLADRDFRTAGLLALAGVGLSIVGSVLNQVVADVDVYAAMETASSTERALLLTEVADARTPLVAGFAIWMIAFPLTAAASLHLAQLGRQSRLTVAIRSVVTAAIGAILVFLSMFITFAAVIAPAHVAGENVLTLARVVGYTASTIDWVVTTIVLGFGPVAAVYAGRGVWAPRWLLGLAAITGVFTVLELGALIADERDLAFPLVPVGMLLLACAGISAMRHSARSVAR
jgi:hypothetical protein